jgi:outer membrane protein OmpA-like peptidoglycan-associated protein
VAGLTLALAVPAYAADAPVRAVVAPVIDLELPTSDLRGVARVEESPRRVRVVLSSELLFSRDSAQLEPAVRGRLREIAGELRSRGPGRLRIVGYTDDLGSAAHGLDLSRRRADAVRRALRPLLPGLPAVVSGRGEADPAAPNTSEANRRKNRRVVLTYTPSGTSSGPGGG